MSFEVSPHWSSANAIPLAVVRYKGKQPGDKVLAKAARRQKRGTACWEGTGATQLTLVLRVVKYRQKHVDGTPGHTIRVWFKRMLPSTPPMFPTYKGSYFTQEGAAYCEV